MNLKVRQRNKFAGRCIISP